MSWSPWASWRRVASARNIWCVGTQFYELHGPLHGPRRPSRDRSSRARDLSVATRSSGGPWWAARVLCVGGHRTRASGPVCARRARSSFAARRGTSRSTRSSRAARISTSSASNLHVVLCLPARTRRSSVVSMLTAGSYVAREASDARGIGRVAWRERRDFARREFGTPHLIFCSTARRPSAGRRRLRSLHSLVFARVQGWPGRARHLPWWRDHGPPWWTASAPKTPRAQ